MRIARQDNEKDSLLSAAIMIVDDEPINIDVVQAFLEEEGFTRFFTEENPKNALSLMEEARPDLLLLDLVMPEISGFEILERVRSHPRFRYLPVIILTASTDTENKLKALELGATDFLAKPLDQSELALRVRNTLLAKAYQDQLAYYDPITKLPNRQLFLEELERSIAEESRRGGFMSILSLQIDQFSDINDKIGQTAGDFVLQKIADRIISVTRASDIVGSSIVFGADEKIDFRLFSIRTNAFVLLLSRIDSAGSSAEVASRILKVVAEPIAFDSRELYLTASIGIATFPFESVEGDDLLHLASSAKDLAHKRGGDNFQFSSKESMASYEKRLSVETKLRHAIERDELVLHYQPKVDVNSGEIVGAEALVRWQTDEGLVPPLDFIPLAEETGLIIPIGEWCLRQGCKDLKQWHDKGIEINLAINLSARQFNDDSFLDSVKKAIKQYSIAPHFLTLELTESILMDDLEEKLILLQSLKDYGFKLSIDDFGTGYSSLSYLRKLPVHELKIDRSFIMEVTSNEDSRAIVSTVVFLAQQLKLSTVAEGIEKPEELNFLKELRCDQFQGYYFSRPIPADQFIQLLQKAGSGT